MSKAPGDCVARGEYIVIIVGTVTREFCQQKEPIKLNKKQLQHRSGNQ